MERDVTAYDGGTTVVTLEVVNIAEIHGHAGQSRQRTTVKLENKALKCRLGDADFRTAEETLVDVPRGRCRQVVDDQWRYLGICLCIRRSALLSPVLTQFPCQACQQRGWQHVTGNHDKRLIL